MQPPTQPTQPPVSQLFTSPPPQQPDTASRSSAPERTEEPMASVAEEAAMANASILSELTNLPSERSMRVQRLTDEERAKLGTEPPPPIPEPSPATHERMVMMGLAKKK